MIQKGGRHVRTTENLTDDKKLLYILKTLQDNSFKTMLSL
jgi:hypothetical protein